MRTIVWFIYFWLYLLSLVPANLYIKYKLSKGHKSEMTPLIEKTVQNWALRLLSAAGAQVTVTGQENLPAEAALFVCNHQGNFDIPLVLSKLGGLKTMVAKKELAKFPGIRSWMAYFDCIFMDRKDPRQSLTCLNQAQALLQKGQSVIIFPEGTRSKGDDLGEFKPGALRCALKSETPIVPVVIDGSYLLMEAHGNRIHPAKVHINILPPVITKALGRESTKTLSEEIKTMIQNQLDENHMKTEK